jgi:uncharacterized protein YndB with AHSA1/START domain
MTLPWSTTFAVATPDDDAILITRDFGAPPDTVWRAMTEPEHLRRWLGSADLPLSTCEMDVRVGGRYRWVFGKDGAEGSMGVSGTFEEVRRPERLVSTEQFDAFPGPSVNTMHLAPTGQDRTSMTLTVRYADRQTRDGWLASGMADGLGVGYETLDGVLAELR